MSGNYIPKLLSLKSVAMGNQKYTNFITKTAVDADLDRKISLFCQKGMYHKSFTRADIDERHKKDK